MAQWSKTSRRKALKLAASGTALTLPSMSVAKSGSEAPALAFPETPVNPVTVSGSETITKAEGSDAKSSGFGVESAAVEEDNFKLYTHTSGAGVSRDVAAAAGAWFDFEIDSRRRQSVDINIDYEYDYLVDLIDSPTPFEETEDSDGVTNPERFDSIANGDSSGGIRPNSPKILLFIAGLALDYLGNSAGGVRFGITLQETTNGKFTDSMEIIDPIKLEESVGWGWRSKEEDSGSETFDYNDERVGTFIADPNKTYRVGVFATSGITATGLSVANANFSPDGSNLTSPGIEINEITIDY